MILLYSLLLLTVTEVIPDSTSHAKMVSMYENALERHPEKKQIYPGRIFFVFFETPSPFAEVLLEKYISEKSYECDNFSELKERDELAWILMYYLFASSEVVTGEILNKQKDTLKEPYNTKFIIRVDSVFMGDIDKGEKIIIRRKGNPYMPGDTVLAFFRHFPTPLARNLFKKHKNDIGYRAPYYLRGTMHKVTSIYYSKDCPSGNVNITKGPLHVTYPTKPSLWNKPFDYPYLEVAGTLGKFIQWIKRWQKDWYSLLTPNLMDSIILNQGVKATPTENRIVRKTVRKAIVK